MKLTTSWMMKQAMPRAISRAPQRGDLEPDLQRRIVEMVHAARHAHQAQPVQRHEGARRSPTSQNQNEHLPQNGSSL